MFKSAFTLIELLVVMAILGILVSLITVNFTTAQQQARDARRKDDIATIQTALEQHYSVYGTYPNAGTVGDAFESGSVPADPKNDSPYVYSWNIAASGYCICANLEKQTGNSTDASCNWATGSSADHLCVENQQ